MSSRYEVRKYTHAVDVAPHEQVGEPGQCTDASNGCSPCKLTRHREFLPIRMCRWLWLSKRIAMKVKVPATAVSREIPA
jgi:hypothetical protein